MSLLRSGLALVSTLTVVLASQAHAASGTWERSWGKDVVTGGGTGFEICTVAANCQAGDSTGGLGGEMHSPEGVATDAAGNVYLADPSNNRIQKFDPSGNFLRAWGKDVVSGGGTGFEICTVAANCQAGATGGLGGEMNDPSGVATDAAGNVYVADTFNQRIQKFDSSGNFLRAWGKDVDSVAAGTGFEICTVAANCQAGATGGLGGEMDTPRAVATDAANNVYLADRLNNRIQKFDSSGSFLRTWGKDVDSVAAGTGFEICTVAADCQAGVAGVAGLGGEMNLPQGVATDAAGAVYLADSSNERIQKFDSSGNFLLAWGKDVITGGGTGFEICTVAANCQAGATGGLGGEMDLPTGVATDAAGNVYLGDRFNDRIQRFVDPVPPVTQPTPSQPSVAATCNGKPATITGTQGADQLSGTTAADVIAALGGNDKVSGLAGNDTICGGPGKDTLKGGKGNDKLFGEAGKDTLKGGPGRDKLVGGPGNDKQIQ